MDGKSSMEQLSQLTAALNSAAVECSDTESGNNARSRTSSLFNFDKSTAVTTGTSTPQSHLSFLSSSHSIPTIIQNEHICTSFADLNEYRVFKRWVVTFAV